MFAIISFQVAIFLYPNKTAPIDIKFRTCSIYNKHFAPNDDLRPVKCELFCDCVYLLERIHSYILCIYRNPIVAFIVLL